MKVSLAMTTYNGTKYIEKQLDSLRTQTYPFDEVVICDDVSKDGTKEFVEQYIDRYSLHNWYFCQNETNLGFAENFKQAISRTTGDIIFLADQDDEWHTDKIEKMISVYMNIPAVKALACNLQFIDENSHLFIPERVPNWYRNMQEVSKIHVSGIDFLTICNSNFAPGCVMSFTREIADLYINTNYPLPIHHDWLLALLAASHNGYYYINDKLIDYRIHSNNAIGVSRAKKSDSAQEQITRLQRMLMKYSLAMDTNYVDKQQLLKNVNYVEARISFYQERSIKTYLKLIVSSLRTKRMYKNIWMMNGKDLLYLLHLVF